MKVLIITILTLALNSCASVVVKPNVLYEDITLYNTIQNQKKELEKNPSKTNINKQLNDYELYTQKAHKIFTENNKRALK